MRVLAVETGCPPGSLALLDGEQVVAELRLDGSQRTVQSMFPELQRLLNHAGWKPRDVQLVAVTVGPGSFTGLRIGVTFAKTWAFATGAAVRGLRTLDVIAAQAETPQKQLWAVLDAQRRQLFAGQYQRSAAGPWTPVGDVQIVNRDHWLDQLTPPCAVTGEGLRAVPQVSQLQPAEGKRIEVLPEDVWCPWAATAGRLAQVSGLVGVDNDFLRLVPYYCRRSAAEEKAAEQDRQSPSAARTS